MILCIFQVYIETGRSSTAATLNVAQVISWEWAQDVVPSPSALVLQLYLAGGNFFVCGSYIFLDLICFFLSFVQLA